MPVLLHKLLKTEYSFVLYTHLYCSFQGLKLVYRFLYLFHKTQFYSPLLWVAGMSVCLSGCFVYFCFAQVYGYHGIWR